MKLTEKVKNEVRMLLEKEGFIPSLDSVNTLGYKEVCESGSGCKWLLWISLDTIRGRILMSPGCYIRGVRSTWVLYDKITGRFDVDLFRERLHRTEDKIRKICA